MGNQNEGAGGTAVSALPMLREERDADEPVFCTIFVANRRAPMDAAGFDDQTVERLVQHQFDLQRVGYRYTYPLAQTEAIVVDEQRVHGTGRQAGARAQSPGDRPSGAPMQRSDEVADHALLLLGDADTGRGGIAGDEHPQRRRSVAGEEAFARAGGFGQDRRAPPSRDRLGDEHGREHDLGGPCRRGMGDLSRHLRTSRSPACASRRRR